MHRALPFGRSAIQWRLMMLVFYHIPKTAGTSLGRAAAEAIRGAHRRVLLTEMPAWLDDLDRGQPGTDGLAFLTGHFAYGVHQRLPGDHRTMTFLRHPVEQTLSMHCEALKRPDIYPHGDLVRLLDDASGQPSFGNAQVRHLASENGRPLTGPLTGRHLARAKRVVTQELTCFGITEYFATSLALINDGLGLALAPRQANISSRPTARDLDPELFSLIWRANGLDRELYDFCLDVFAERTRRLAAASTQCSMVTA